jgi:retinol dehydrogenase-12
MRGDLQGKVFLVTGATEGIGKAAAREFAKRGAELVLVARNKEKGERLVAELKNATGNNDISLLLADMSSIADIKRVAAEFRAPRTKLDVLVNNAGALFSDYQLSKDGLEMTFALNHMAYFGLTFSLLDLLKSTKGARVVSTSSMGHKIGKFELGRIAKREPGHAGWAAYGESKYANILFTRELARRLKGSGATANCFHPGFVYTGFGLNNGGFIKWAFSVVSPIFARTPEKGADTLIWLATSPEAASHTGEYFSDRKVTKVVESRHRDNGELAKGLWDLSEKLYN